MAIAPRASRVVLLPLFDLSKIFADEPNEVITAWVRPLIERALEAKRAREKVGGDREDQMGADQGSLLEHIAESTEDVKLVRDEVSFTRTTFFLRSFNSDTDISPPFRLLVGEYSVGQS